MFDPKFSDNILSVRDKQVPVGTADEAGQETASNKEEPLSEARRVQQRIPSQKISSGMVTGS